MSIFKDIAKFFGKTLPHAIGDFFKCVKTDGDRIAVAITEGIQTALKSGAVTEVAQIIEAIFPNVKNVPTDLVAKLQVLVPKVLAAELEIQALPAGASEDQIKTFVSDVLTSFNVKQDKSKLWTTLSGSLYSILRAYTGGTSMTWIEVVNEVEEAFQAFKNEQATDQDGE